VRAEPRTTVRRAAAAAAAGAALVLGYLLSAAPAVAAPHHSAARAAAAVSTSRQQATEPRAAAPATTTASYVTSRGDTLYGAGAVLCDRSFWPVLWAANRHAVPNPDLLPTGITLVVPPCSHPTQRQVDAALAAIPPPPPPPPPAPAVQPASTPPMSGAAPVAPAPAGAVSGSVTPSSGYEACVIAAESGGNPGAVNASSGAGGLYQFLPSTWQALGYPGLPQDASPATQQQAFDQLYAQQGSSPWVSDGC